jgi:adenylate kinase family enzyme
VKHRVGTRIIVIGSSNAGKSTLGHALAARLDAPLIELDALHWEPGWTPADRDIFRARVRQAITADCWVLAGNYFSHQQDVSWPAADTVVWLDLSLGVVLWRCIVRSWERGRSREDLWGTGNREIFWKHLMLWDTDKSLFAYIIKTHHARRRELARMASDPRWAHITFIRLRSDEHAARLLVSMPPDRTEIRAKPTLAAVQGSGTE